MLEAEGTERRDDADGSTEKIEEVALNDNGASDRLEGIPAGKALLSNSGESTGGPTLSLLTAAAGYSPNWLVVGRDPKGLRRIPPSKNWFTSRMLKRRAANRAYRYFHHLMRQTPAIMSVSPLLILEEGGAIDM